MVNLFRHFPLSGVLAVLTLVAGSGAAQAQVQRVAQQPFSGGVTLINGYIDTAAAQAAPSSITGSMQKPDHVKVQVLQADAGHFSTPPKAPVPAPPKAHVPKKITIDFAPLLEQKWQELRAQMEATAPRYFNERAIGPDHGKHSFRTSKTHLQTASDAQLFVGTDANGLTLRAYMPGNRFSTYIRTPGPVPEGLDPGFQAFFDAEISIDFTLHGRRITASPARLKLTVHRPTGKNLTGQSLLVMQGLVKEVGGPDWVGRFVAMLNSRELPLDRSVADELARFAPILDRAPTNAVVTTDYDARSGNIVLRLQRAPR